MLDNRKNEQRLAGLDFQAFTKGADPGPVEKEGWDGSRRRVPHFGLVHFIQSAPASGLADLAAASFPRSDR